LGRLHVLKEKRRIQRNKGVYGDSKPGGMTWLRNCMVEQQLNIAVVMQS
jgi:hypothetical protein